MDRTTRLEEPLSRRDSGGSAEALIHAAKCLIATGRRERADGQAGEEQDAAARGVFKMFMAKQNHKQAVLLRRADQTWNTQKQLRVMEHSVRRTVAAKKDKLKDLQRLNQSVLDLQEIVTVPEDAQESKPLETRLLAKILKSDAAKRVAASTEVENELVDCASFQGRETWKCPKCNVTLLVELVARHVETCSSPANKALNKESKRKPGDRRGSVVMQRGLGLATQEICSLCGEKVLSSKLEVHIVQCRERILKRERSRGNVLRRGDPQNSDDHSLYARMVSQPPRNVRVFKTSSISIKLEWDPPIFTGGYDVPIVDYLIEYSCTETIEVGNRLVTKLTPQPPLSSSRWCLARPVANNGFEVTGLRANTEYRNISVRARNKIGISDRSNVIDCAKTLLVQPASSPMHLVALGIKSTSIEFKWSPPFSNGGTPDGIKFYKFKYTMIVDNTMRAKKAKREHFERITKGSKCSLRLRGLGGKACLRKVSVVAITSYRDDTNKEILLYSPPSNVIDKVCTLEESEQERYHRELRRIMTMDSEFVNTSIYTGFSQRYLRSDLMEKLKESLEGIVEEESEEDSDIDFEDFKRQRRLSYQDLGDKVSMRRTKLETDVFQSKMRRRHFTHKIRKLKMSISDLENKKSEHVMRRARLVKEIQEMEHRSHELRLEFDRASAHKGHFLDSRVIHGRTQRFVTSVLSETITQELERLSSKIYKYRQEIVQIYHFIETIKKEKKVLEASVKERQAALLCFEKEAIKLEKKAKLAENWQRKGLLSAFTCWRAQAKKRKHFRAAAEKILRQALNYQASRAWRKWVEVVNTITSRQLAKGQVSGVGSSLLAHVQDERKDLLGELEEALDDFKSTVRDFEESKVTHRQQKILKSSPYYEKAIKAVEQHAEPALVARYHQGETYLAQRSYDIALLKFQSYAEAMYATRKVPEQCRAWLGMAKCIEGKKELEKAQVYYDRAKCLARECGAKQLEARAILGISRSHMRMCAFKQTLEYADQALQIFEDLHDMGGQAQAYMLLKKGYRGLGDMEKAEDFAKRAKNIEEENSQRIHTANEFIDEAEKKLISITAERSSVVQLELASVKVPVLRKEIEDKRVEVEDLVEKVSLLEKRIETDAKRAKELEEQSKIVERCKETYLDSNVVHGVLQRFHVKELKKTLQRQSELLQERLETSERELKSRQVRMSNKLDDISELQLELSVELGDLMKHIMHRRNHRFCAMNPVNLSSNDVLGFGLGGVEKLVCALANKLYVFDLRDGALLRVISEGHTGSITAVFYFEQKIYTGGVDNDIRVWEGEGEYECSQVLQGHTATIWSLFANTTIVISGSADLTMRIWDQATAKCVRIVTEAHTRTIRSLHVSLRRLVSAGTDYQVRIWDLDSLLASGMQDENIHMRTTLAKCEKQLSGHRASVTCVRMQGHEVVSGDASGTVIFWDVINRKPLLYCNGHKGAIRCLQFDSTKIVSGGVDMVIRIFDSSTGSCLLALRGHKHELLQLQFDSYRIISVSADGELRHWNFSGNRNEVVPTKDKLHILQEGQTLKDVAQRFACKVDDLKNWNNIKSSKTVYNGMRLIVAKSLSAPKPEQKSSNGDDEGN